MPDDKLKVSMQIDLDKQSVKQVEKSTENIRKKIEKPVNLTSWKQLQQLEKQRESNLQQEHKTRLAIEKSTDRQKMKQASANAELTKQVKNVELFQSQLDRAISKLKSGQYGKYADSDAFDKLQSKAGVIDTSNVAKSKEQIKDLTNEFKNLQLQAQQSKGGLTEFADNFKHNAVKYAEFFAVTQAITLSLRAMGSAVSTLYEISNIMNEVRIVTGKSVEETNELAVSYNNLAKQLSTTTVELADSAKELFRQGLSAKEVEERLKAITVYSKISGLSVQESTEIITSNANGSGKAINNLIDIMSNLGDSTAAGADEIGKAMARVSGSIKNAGISYEQLAGMIATVSSTTRESAETIGNSMKSLLARYTAIKAKGYKSGELNEITKALKTVGINAQDSEGQLRPFGEVIDEVGRKFSTLDGNTKKYLATQLGGTYQSNRLLVVLNQYDEVLKNTELAYNSAGNAQQKFDIYLESNEAKLNKLKATLEGLWIKSFNSEILGNMVTFGTSLLELTENTDVLTMAVYGLSGAFVGLAIQSAISAVNTLTVATVASGGAFATLNAIIMANPFVALGVAVGVALVAIDKFANSTENLIDESNELIATTQQEASENTALATSVEELSNKQNKSYAESEKLRTAKEQLIQIYPELKSVIESETLKQGELASAIANVTAKRIEDSKQALKQQRYELALKKAKTSLQKQGIANRAVNAIDTGTKSSFEGEINALSNVESSFAQEIDAIDKQLLQIDSTVADTLIKKSSDGIPTDNDEEVDNYYNPTDDDKKSKQKITLLSDLEKQLLANANAISIQKEKTSQLNDEDAKKLDSLKSEIKLYEQRQQLVHLQANATRAEIASIKAKKTLTDEDKKKIEELQSDLYSYGQEWWSLTGNIITANKAISDFGKKAQEAIDKQTKANLEFTKDQLEDMIKLLEDDLKSALESTENAIKKEAKTSEDAYNARIQAIKDTVESEQTSNEILEEQATLKEKLLALDKLKEQRANILSQKNVRFLVGNEFQFIADPLALKENSDAMATAEKDLADTKLDIKQKERKREQDAEIKSLEIQRDKAQSVFNQRLEDFKTYSDSVLNELKTDNSLTAIEQDNLYATLKSKDEAYFTGKLAYVQEMASKIRADLASIGQIDTALDKMDTSSGTVKPTSLIAPTSSISKPSGVLSGIPSVLGQSLSNASKVITNKSSSSSSVSIGNLNLTTKDAGSFVRDLQRIVATSN